MNSSSMIIDREEYPFAMLANAVIDDHRLDTYDAMTFWALKRLAYRKADGRDMATSSADRLMEAVRCSRKRLFQSLATLEELGYIERHKQTHNGFQRVNVYVILGPVGAKAKQQEGEKEAFNTPDSVENNSIEQNGLRETQGVFQVDGSHFPGIPRQFSRETPNTNTKNSILRTQDIPPLPPQRGECGEWNDEIESLTSAFPESRTENLPEKMELWAKEYGADNLRAEVAEILKWRQGKGKSKKYSILSRFVDNWLRTHGLETTLRGYFSDFWECWPGDPDGRGGAEQVFVRRLSRLPDNKARRKALDAIEEQMSDLVDRIERGEKDRRYIGSVKNWIWNADLGEGV